MDSLWQAFSPLQDFIGSITMIFPYVWFIFLPPALFFMFDYVWSDYVRTSYFSKMKYTLLEVIPPRDIEKSPFSMELVFDTLAATEKTLSTFEEYLVGERLPRFSFEIVGDGGVAHFYIRTQTRFRHFLEATVYSQYPDIQLIEVPDYVRDVPSGIPNGEWDLWGTDLEYAQPNPFPIRTYRSFQEDVTGKMLDPLAHMIEILGKLPPGHKLWFQCVVQATKPAWYKEGKKFVTELMIKMAKDKGVGTSDVEALEMKLTPTEKKVLEAVEMNIGKTMFHTRIRYIYLGPAATLDKSSFVSGFMGAIKQFNDNNLNSLKPNAASKTFANYVLKKGRLRYRQRVLLERFRTRDMDPFSTTMIMSSAELATIYHMPDMTVLAPNLIRVGAKRGTAPANLPVD